MSPGQKTKIQSAAIVASVAILAMVVGVLLDNKVVPENNKPLMTNEVEEQGDNKAAEVDKEKTNNLNEQVAERSNKISTQIEQLDKKTEVTIEKAKRTITQANELVSKADLPESASSNKAPTQNQEIAERLAKAHMRLDALKK